MQLILGKQCNGMHSVATKEAIYYITGNTFSQVLKLLNFSIKNLNVEIRS